MHILDALQARGLLYAVTDPDGLRARLDEGPITYYAGYDPTAPSLTVGNLVPLMLQAHVQRAGHKPLVVHGGGTGLLGDPSGKAKTRETVLTEADVAANLAGQRPQFARFLDFDDPVTGARLFDNAEWLMSLGYVEFLRDVGRHFSVNEMLTVETYARRLAANEHLSFIEFNYRLVQAYDFLHLFRVHGCQWQMGGSDQWGNCVAGTELIRKVAGGKAWVLTAPLLLTASGEKMGKTERGAVWLDAARTSPFEYFQFWINCDDRDVGRLLRIFSFLELDAIEALAAAEDVAGLMRCKARLAWEATALAHGAEAADSALATSMLLFDLARYFAFSDAAPGRAEVRPDVPTFEVPRAWFEEGVPAWKLFVESGLAASGKQAKALFAQGGATVGGQAVDGFATLGPDALTDGTLLLRQGKKRYVLVVAR